MLNFGNSLENHLTSVFQRVYLWDIEIHYTDSIQTNLGDRKAQADKENDPSPTDPHRTDQKGPGTQVEATIRRPAPVALDVTTRKGLGLSTGGRRRQET